jgi:hypothetical protein
MKRDKERLNGVMEEVRCLLGDKENVRWGIFNVQYLTLNVQCSSGRNAK